MRWLLLLALAAGVTQVAAFGQEENELHHHNLDVGIGPGIPTGVSRSYLGTAPMIGVHYGYRITRLFQADAGLQIAWGAAGGNQTSVLTDLGPVQGGDHEWMFPLGGRLIVPQPFRKIELALGGGEAYLHYSETAPSNGYYQTNCYSCTSRGGWGPYGLASLSYFLDSSQIFRVGTTVQYISGSTNGQAVGNVPGIHTADHWLNVTFRFGLSF